MMSTFSSMMTSAYTFTTAVSPVGFCPSVQFSALDQRWSPEWFWNPKTVWALATMVVRRRKPIVRKARFARNKVFFVFIFVVFYSLLSGFGASKIEKFDQRNRRFPLFSPQKRLNFATNSRISPQSPPFSTHFSHGIARWATFAAF